MDFDFREIIGNNNEITEKSIDVIINNEEISTSEVTRISNVINNLKLELNDKFVEREKEIDMLTLAIVSESNAFLHGKPGTGKSNLVEEYSSRISGCNYFRMLMSKTTEPSEIFGPVSIDSLKKDIHKIITKNKLPQSNICFLDEVFKANSAILNGLLTIMNEKLFFNDTVEKVPIISVIGASNEFQEDDSLDALYDRFLLKWNVEKIKDSNNRIKLFKSFVDSRNNVNNNKLLLNKKTIISYDDLISMINLAKSVKIDNDVLNEYNKLFIKLEEIGINVSDRRKNESLKVIQASSVIDGRLHADISDFESLIFCLWDDLDDISKVKSVISSMVNSDKDFIKGYRKSLDDIKKDICTFLTEHKHEKDAEVINAVRIQEKLSDINLATNTLQRRLDSSKKDNVKKELTDLIKKYKDLDSDLTDLLL